MTQLSASEQCVLPYETDWVGSAHAVQVRCAPLQHA